MPVSSEREALTKLIAAWESLPLGRYTVDEIQAWLIADMVPAIGNARAALEAALSLPQGAPEWQPIETAPKDGSWFLAWCIERPPFDPAPTEFMDFARWSGTHWASRSGAIVEKWMPLTTKSPLPASPNPEGL